MKLILKIYFEFLFFISIIFGFPFEKKKEVELLPQVSNKPKKTTLRYPTIQETTFVFIEERLSLAEPPKKTLIEFIFFLIHAMTYHLNPFLIK